MIAPATRVTARALQAAGAAFTRMHLSSWRSRELDRTCIVAAHRGRVGVNATAEHFGPACAGGELRAFDPPASLEDDGRPWTHTSMDDMHLTTLGPSISPGYRGHSLDIRLTRDTFTIRGRDAGPAPISIGFRGDLYDFAGLTTMAFPLPPA